MKGYNDEYGTDYLDTMRIEPETGQDFLTNLLKSYSPENRLLVICIAPMHDLVNIPLELYKNMEIWSMGAGFEETNGDSISVPKVGYNWGICPEITQVVLNNLRNTGTSLNVVSSGIVRRLNSFIDLDTYNRWMTRFENDNTLPKITRAIIKDWLYCNKGNKLVQHKNLCDPLTLILAAGHFDYTTKLINTTVDNIDNFEHYLVPTNPDKHMINMVYSKDGNTKLVTDFNPIISKIIVDQLETALF